ncbi:MAG: hypothetical protein HXL11_00840 [Candidatus Nanosynbacter sp.]|jgi:hypothetical protein cdivTM_09948|nr:hypothetical protein [Candidatus Nanosynbacter sp.]
MDNSNNNPFLASNQFNQSGQTPANFGANNPSGSNPFAQNNPVSSTNNSIPANPVASEAPVASANSGDIYQNLYQSPFTPGMPAANPLNKNYADMTGEERKEASRIAKAKNRIDLMKTVGLIVVSLLAVLFIGLFIWMWVKWNDASTNVKGKVDVAVAEAKNELQTKLESEFEEKEKYPYKVFTGPTDLGELSFEYPKTWSLYVQSSANRGGDYAAYLNPGQVNVVQDDTVMALRVSIKGTLFDQAISDFAEKVRSGDMTLSTTVVNGNNVNVYTGKLDNEYQGIICVFKLRDKTVMLQTDSTSVFSDDFYRILKTVKFNS